MNNQLISLLLPTRGRPKLVERFFQSILYTTFNLKLIEVILYIDDDDFESHNIEFSDIQLRKIIGPRGSMGFYNTTCLKEALGQIIILVNDDMIIQTNSWDEIIRSLDKKYYDGIYLAYGNDMFKSGKLCTFPIISRTTCEILVNPYPKKYKGAFIDYHLFDIFKRLEKNKIFRIIYLKDVIFEHLHYRSGKALMDNTYSNRNRFGDDNTFIALTQGRINIAKKIVLQIHGAKFTSSKDEFENTTEYSYNFAVFMKIIIIKFILDKSSPFLWRVRLGIWLLLRQIYCRYLVSPE